MKIVGKVLALFRKKGSATGDKAVVDTLPQNNTTFRCKLCELTSTHRGSVYEHLKAAHKEVIDRNSQILEEEGSPQA